MIPSDEVVSTGQVNLCDRQNENPDAHLRQGEGAVTTTGSAPHTASLKPRHHKAPRATTGRLKPWKSRKDRNSSKVACKRRRVSFSFPVATETVSKTENRNDNPADPTDRESGARRRGGYRSVTPLLTSDISDTSLVVNSFPDETGYLYRRTSAVESEKLEASLPANSVQRETDRTNQAPSYPGGSFREDTQVICGRPLETRKAPPTVSRFDDKKRSSTTQWSIPSMTSIDVDTNDREPVQQCVEAAINAFDGPDADDFCLQEFSGERDTTRASVPTEACMGGHGFGPNVNPDWTDETYARELQRDEHRSNSESFKLPVYRDDTALNSITSMCSPKLSHRPTLIEEVSTLLSPRPVVNSNVCTAGRAECDVTESALVASYPSESTSDLDMVDEYQPLSLWSNYTTSCLPDDFLLQDILLFDQDENEVHQESTVEAISFEEDDRKPAAKPGNAAVDLDLELALRLQREESESARAEENLMYTSATGKAWKFVEQAMELHKRLNCTVVAPIAVDDMVFTAERLLLTQEEFRAAGKPTMVDLGYHYTNSSNLATIRTDGLMNRKEQETHNVSTTRFRGSAYGSGIYLATNPSAYHGKYGDMGLLVARLRGDEADFPTGGKRFDKGNDSLIVFRDHLNEFMVLPSARQCTPILHFDASCIVRFDPDSTGNSAVFDCHLRLQHIIDVIFNDGVPTALPLHVRGPSITNNPVVSTSVPFVYPGSDSSPTSNPTSAASNIAMASHSTYQLRLERRIQKRHQLLKVKQQALSRKEKVLPQQQQSETIHFIAPETLGAATEKCFRKVTQALHSTLANECLICLDPLMRGTIISLDTCNHMFHHNCIVEALGRNQACPSCRTVVGDPQGRMPSGSMSITRSSMSCSGFEQTGTICISYTIPKGVQKSYHPNPGQSHGSANRCAYVPDTVEGTNLLKRLTYAFQHGLTFSVGVSMSSGRSNSVIWALPHKTSTKSSSHGFPDPHYFVNCNLELDERRVPIASKLSEQGVQNFNNCPQSQTEL